MYPNCRVHIITNIKAIMGINYLFRWCISEKMKWDHDNNILFVQYWSLSLNTKTLTEWWITEIILFIEITIPQMTSQVDLLCFRHRCTRYALHQLSTPIVNVNFFEQRSYSDSLYCQILFGTQTLWPIFENWMKLVSNWIMNEKMHRVHLATMCGLNKFCTQLFLHFLSYADKRTRDVPPTMPVLGS